MGEPFDFFGGGGGGGGGFGRFLSGKFFFSLQTNKAEFFFRSENRAKKCFGEIISRRIFFHFHSNHVWDGPQMRIYK